MPHPPADRTDSLFDQSTPQADKSRRRYRGLIAVTVALTFVLIMLGAYVRLSDAGLGCPDWPGCYGALTPTQASEQIARAVDMQGGEHGAVSMGKAWREMVHRYLASTVGLLILVIAALAIRHRRAWRASPALAVVLVGVVILQGLFGKWTVTLLLKPAIVTGHLAGGMLTLVMLVWLWLRAGARVRHVDPEPAAALRVWTILALVAVSAQILLGGWTSTNYAALACPDFPACQGQWWPEAAFDDAFHVMRELGRTGDGRWLPSTALTAIHLTHRLGAVVVAIVVGLLGWRALRVARLRGLGILLLVALALQWTLGIANVVFGLPLAVAVAHNGGAALLLVVTVVLHFGATRARLQI